MSEPLLASSESCQSTIPRRRYSAEFKRTLVEESLRPGASTAKLALQHRLNANILHTWRWQYRNGALGPITSASPSLIPVNVKPVTGNIEQSSDDGSEARPAFAQREPILDIRCGQLQLRFIGDVNPDVLRQVLASLHS
jgi:transposase